MKKILIISVFLTCWLAFGSPSIANVTAEKTDLMDMSIEDLVNIEVTTVSRSAKKLSDAAAAVFVITQADILRSGATSIPEALRMAPGVEVARIDANKWAITIRGFNGRFANKLLVLMDGRTLYTPTFSGVYWDMQDYLLEDIDRIEVIRGPGASLWGANAVNGVINIITKTAKESQGKYATLGVGTEEKFFAGGRYGGNSGESLSYRIYTKYFDRDHAVDADGNDTVDQWDGLSGGFRLDWVPNESSMVTLQGSLLDGEEGETITSPSLTAPYSFTTNEENKYNAGNILGRWEHHISDTSDIAVQVYYDRLERNTNVINVTQDTVDIDFQHQFRLGSRHQIIWGSGYRYIKDEFDNSFSISMIPDSKNLDLFSAFVQDEIQIVTNRLGLILGSKFEHNDFTGFEIQPSGRVVWKPAERQTLWGSISRAVRTPSRGEHDTLVVNQVIPPNTLFPGSPLMPVTLEGNRDFESETLIAYELGYRIQPSNRLSLDFATFYNVYDNLRTIEPDGTFSSTAGNNMEGDTYGLEFSAEFHPRDWWRLQFSYSFLEMDLSLKEGSLDTISVAAEGESPKNMLSLRSLMDLPFDLEMDLWFRFVDELPSQNVSDYASLDVRLAWKPKKWLELAVVGQNLIEENRPEYRPEFIETLPTEVERGVYVRASFRF